MRIDRGSKADYGLSRGWTIPFSTYEKISFLAAAFHYAALSTRSWHAPGVRGRVLRVHHLQHVPFEGLGSIEPAMKEKGHTLSSTHLYAGQALPPIDGIDWLIVMGGPMGIYDVDAYPWLNKEKQFIKEAIDSGKTVLGICLGAQLVADALGARVYRNKYREIGWFNINRSPEVGSTILSTAIPEQAEVFHWHGDTFDIPKGANAIADSEACKNQGFILHDRVVAFQFHLETTLESSAALIENCRNELDGSQYVQSEEEMLSEIERFSTANQVMSSVLNALESKNIRSGETQSMAK